MPQSKKTNGPVPAERAAHGALEPESHVRLKPKTLQPRTPDEVRQALAKLSEQLQREIVEGIEAGTMSSDEAVDLAIESTLDVIKDRMSAEEREAATADLRVALRKLWRDTK